MKKKVIISIVLINLIILSIFFTNFGRSEEYTEITFNFEKDSLGSSPSDFTLSGDIGAGYFIIVKDIGTRLGKSAEFYFDGVDSIVATINTGLSIIKGTITYFFRINDTSGINQLNGFSTPEPIDVVYIVIGDYLGGGSGVYDITGTKLAPITQNKWYKCKIEFDCNIDQYNVYINDSLVGTDIDFASESDTIQYFSLGANAFFGGVEHLFWIDHITVKGKIETETKAKPKDKSVIFPLFSAFGFFDAPYFPELVAIVGFIALFSFYKISKRLRKKELR